MVLPPLEHRVPTPPPSPQSLSTRPLAVRRQTHPHGRQFWRPVPPHRPPPAAAQVHPPPATMSYYSTMDLHSASVAGLQAPASNVLTWAGAAIGALVLVCVAVAPQTAERSAVLYQPVSVGVRAPETALMAARGRGKNRGRVAVEEPKKETGNFVSNFVNAIDFAAPRSKEVPSAPPHSQNCTPMGAARTEDVAFSVGVRPPMLQAPLPQCPM